jgi:hypothetical protein
MALLGVDMTEKKADPELAKRLKEKLEKELIPRLQSSKIQMRTVVAVNVIALVDRQIGKGEGPLEAEWEKLRVLVQDRPKAVKLITDLQAAMLKYDEELRASLEQAEADEEAMRKAANGIIRSAVMAKLKSLQEADREEDARQSELATEAVIDEVRQANAAEGIPDSPFAAAKPAADEKEKEEEEKKA